MRTNPNTLHALKQTHGRAGQPPMPAAFDPNSEPEILDALRPGDVEDLVSPMVDSDHTSLHLALLDAMSGATTWRF